MSRWAAHVAITEEAMKEYGLPLVRAARERLVEAANKEGVLDPATYRFTIETRDEVIYRERDYVAQLTARTTLEEDLLQAFAAPVWPSRW